MEYKVSSFVLLLMMGAALLIGIDQFKSSVPIVANVESVAKVHSSSIVDMSNPDFKVYVNYTDDKETYRGFIKGSEDDFNTRVYEGGTIKCRLNKDTSEFHLAMNAPSKLSFCLFVGMGIILALSLFWSPKVKNNTPKREENNEENLEGETEGDN